MDTPAARATSVIVVLATSAILEATFAGGGDVGLVNAFRKALVVLGWRYEHDCF